MNFKTRGVRSLVCLGALLVLYAVSAGPAFADGCDLLGLGPDKPSINTALKNAVSSAIQQQNGGLRNHMWATIVDMDGIVCAVAYTGPTRLSQWPGSRLISAQKANTATMSNLPAGSGGTIDALSTANLFSATQPGGILWGIQLSNPVDTAVAYGGVEHYGQSTDPLIGKFVGGINVTGGGLALYGSTGWKVGGLGVSGDTPCAEHNVAWRVRNTLGLDNLSATRVRGLSAVPHQDNIIYDIDASGKSTSGFGHPKCGFGEEAVTLPATR